MTAMILLIRHAPHSHLGHILSGRMPGIGLSAAGDLQARALAKRLAPLRLAAIHTSPVERARTTASLVAAGRPVAPVVADALDEIDFGDWTGKSFTELADEPGWAAWNSARGSARANGGETMIDAQSRIVRHIDAVAARFAGEAIALVSHCDMIRAAIAHYLGLSLDTLLRFEIDPGSVSRLVVGPWGGRIVSINETPR